jgi:hypothetical protein
MGYRVARQPKPALRGCVRALAGQLSAAERGGLEGVASRSQKPSPSYISSKYPHHRQLLRPARIPYDLIDRSGMLICRAVPVGRGGFYTFKKSNTPLRTPLPSS